MVVNSTTDIVNALVAKGVLTEEEGALLNKGREGEAAGQAKALKKAGKVSISDAIDNAKIYGDIRARYERRDGDVVSNSGINADSNRARYKITLGVETTSGQWYSDLALALSSNGRSDNVSMGDGFGIGTSGTTDQGAFTKEKNGIYLKRAMFGYKPTDWLAVEAGLTKNPLYMVNAMVFDHDIVMQGLNQKLNYKLNDSTTLFGNLGQWIYSGKEVASTNGGSTTTTRQNMILAFQGGVEQAFNDRLSAKGAIGYYNYTGNVNTPNTNFKPQALNSSTAGVYTGTNNLQIVDALGEANYMVTSNIGVRPYAEYTVNTDADARAAASGVAGSVDDSAWLVGVTVGSAKDLKSFASKKMAKGDWNLNLWYQSVGMYALDANAVDTDIFDGRLNMEGTTLKAQYNVEDNVALNFTGGWGSRKNSQYGTSSTKTDISGNIDNYNLYQFDVTYKF